jgi:AraC family L-rhamnose operon regulatory protein RhaS
MSSLRSHWTIGQKDVKLSARSPVRWTRLKVEKRVEPHDHEFTEIVLIFAGQANHVTEKGARKIGPGDVLIVPPGQRHAFGAVQNLELMNIYFLPEWFLPELDLNEASHGILPIFFAQSIFKRAQWHMIHEMKADSSILGQVVRELEQIEIGVGRTWAARWVTCCFFKVLLLLADTYQSSLAGRSSVTVSPVIWSAFAEVDRVAHLGEKLDLKKLARELGCTRDHFTRIFRSETGETPNAFYQARRLQFVCRGLLDTKLTVAEIAYRFGYADEAHLCRLFRQRLLLTPSDYRRKFHHGGKTGGVEPVAPGFTC